MQRSRKSRNRKSASPRSLPRHRTSHTSDAWSTEDYLKNEFFDIHTNHRWSSHNHSLASCKAVRDFFKKSKETSTLVTQEEILLVALYAEYKQFVDVPPKSRAEEIWMVEAKERHDRLEAEIRRKSVMSSSSEFSQPSSSAEHLSVPLNSQKSEHSGPLSFQSSSLTSSTETDTTDTSDTSTATIMGFCSADAPLSPGLLEESSQGVSTSSVGLDRNRVFLSQEL